MNCKKLMGLSCPLIAIGFVIATTISMGYFSSTDRVARKPRDGASRKLTARRWKSVYPYEG